MIKLVFEIALSALLLKLIPFRIRERFMPWALALFIGLPALTPYLSSVLMQGVILASFLLCCFLSNGYQVRHFRHNAVFIFFILFWGYQCVSMFFGERVSYGLVYYLRIPFETVFVGYAVGVWLLGDPSRWERLLKAVSAVLLVIVVVYILKGALAHGMEHQASFRGEIGLDEADAANPNWVGLVLIGILPYPVFLLLTKVGRCRVAWRLCAFGVSAILTLMLVRTGSRNACLGLVPLIYFMVFGVKASFSKRCLVFLALSLALSVLIVRTTSNLSDLRIFNANKSGDITSGRLDFYRYNMLYRMTPLQRWFGCGAWLDHSLKGKIVMANGHSVYVQILRQSGYVGMFFFLLFASALIVKSAKNGSRGRLALAMFGCWALTGLGESGSLLSGGGSSKILLGMAIAFCTNMRMGFHFGAVGTNRFPRQIPYGYRPTRRMA